MARATRLIARLDRERTTPVHVIHRGLFGVVNALEPFEINFNISALRVDRAFRRINRLICLRWLFKTSLVHIQRIERSYNRLLLLFDLRIHRRGHCIR